MHPFSEYIRYFFGQEEMIDRLPGAMMGNGSGACVQKLLCLRTGKYSVRGSLCSWGGLTLRQSLPVVSPRGSLGSDRTYSTCIT